MKALDYELGCPPATMNASPALPGSGAGERRTTVKVR